MPSEVDSVQVAGNYVLGHSKKGYFLIDMKTQKSMLQEKKQLVFMQKIEMMDWQVV